MVSGNYVSTFKEASHVIFNGHLDNPFFRAIAIQKIISVEGGNLVTEKSGSLKIKTGAKESVALTYRGLFGNKKTTGHPFKES